MPRALTALVPKGDVEVYAAAALAECATRWQADTLGLVWKDAVGMPHASLSQAVLELAPATTLLAPRRSSQHGAPGLARGTGALCLDGRGGCLLGLRPSQPRRLRPYRPGAPAGPAPIASSPCPCRGASCIKPASTSQACCQREPSSCNQAWPCMTPWHSPCFFLRPDRGDADDETEPPGRNPNPLLRRRRHAVPAPRSSDSVLALANEVASASNSSRSAAVGARSSRAAAKTPPRRTT